MPRLADLIVKGSLPDYRAKGPAEFEGQTLVIMMSTLKITQSVNSQSGQNMAGFEVDVVDDKGIRHKLMSQSASLTQQVTDQFIPFIDEIGEELTVDLIGQVSQKDPKRKVYHFG